MPNHPLRPCRHPGCHELTSQGYCPQHRPAPVERSEEAAAWHRLYSTDAWRKLRSAQLLREPFCVECARRGVRTRATDVDHIRDHKGDRRLFFDAANLQSLCHSCHSRKTLREMQKTPQKTAARAAEVAGRLGGRP